MGYMNSMLHFASVICVIRSYKNSAINLQQAKINIYGINPISGLDKDKGVVNTVY